MIVKIICPFCELGQGLAVVNTEEGSIRHTMPCCEEFVLLEPGDFMHLVKRRFEGTRAPTSECS